VKASFIPGDLHLTETPDGFSVVTLHGKVVFRSRAARHAQAKFNKLRSEMEAMFPTAEYTPEEKAALWRQATLDGMIGFNSLGGRKKKTSAGGTRTFGG
jgi:hypothetical protein